MGNRDRMLVDGPTPETHDTLRPGEVVLWLIDTAASDEPLAAIAAALTDAERVEMERRAAPHRRRFAMARLALRRLIARLLTVAPERVAIVRAPGGRPQLDPDHGSKLSFSLSYAGERALIAVAEGMTVGVDIEKIRPIAEHDAIVRSRFSAAEIKAWTRLAPKARTAAFYEAWTRKEAVVKAIGIGLALPLDRLTVTIGSAAEARVVEIDGHAAHHWRLIDIADIPGHKAALAVAPAEGTSELARGPALRRLPDWCGAEVIVARPR